MAFYCWVLAGVAQPEVGIPGLMMQMHNPYNWVILLYKQFCECICNSSTLLLSKPRDPGLKTHTNIQMLTMLPQLSAAKSTADDDSLPSNPFTATSSPLSEPPDESNMKEMNNVKSDASRPCWSTHNSMQDLPPLASMSYVLQCHSGIHTHSCSRNSSYANSTQHACWCPIGSRCSKREKTALRGMS